MQSIKKLCTLLKNCLYKCFRDEEDDYRDRVIELEERIFDNRPKSENSFNQINENRNSQPQLFSNVQSPKKSNYQSPSRKGSYNQNDKPRQSSASADSYFTVNSGTSSVQTISRRKFQRANSLKKSLFHGQQALNSSKAAEFKDMHYDNYNQNELTLSRVQSQYSSLSDALYEWNESQYERASKNIYFQLSTTEQSKLNSNLLINQAVNKIEDFYTFYFNDMNSQFVSSGKQQQKIFQQYQGHYFRKYPQFKCMYHTQKDNMNPESNFMVLMKFQSNIASPLEFLKWYNSLLSQLKIFNFQKIKLIQNGIYPIFQIQQFGSDINEKYIYLTVRQIEVVKFENEPDVQYVMQLDCNFRKGENFKSLIRFSDSQTGLVQIYCQLSEKINVTPQKYFQKKFKNLEQILKQRLLSMSLCSRIGK